MAAGASSVADRQRCAILTVAVYYVRAFATLLQCLYGTAGLSSRLLPSANPKTNLNASKNSGGACQPSLESLEPLARVRIVRESQLGDATWPHEHRGAVEDLKP